MASGSVAHLPRRMFGEITTAELLNDWQTNGVCFWEIIENVCHAHYTIRRGTYTDGTICHHYGGGFTPTSSSVATISGSTGANGYAIMDINSNVKVYGITNNGSVIFDLYWVLTEPI